MNRDTRENINSMETNTEENVLSTEKWQQPPFNRKYENAA
jgi:hypothetical protein